MFLFISDDPSETTSSVIFSFSDVPTSTFPSGTSIPAVPTGGPGSGGQIYVCYPVDPSAPSAIPSDPIPTLAPSDSTSAPADPTSAPSDPTSAPPSPTSGQGGPTYICYPAGPSAPPAPIPSATNMPVPSDPVPTSDAPSVSAPDPTAGVPPPVHTDKHGPGGPDYVCYPVDPASIPTPLPSTASDPVPTSTPSISESQ